MNGSTNKYWNKLGNKYVSQEYDKQQNNFIKDKK